MLCLLFLFDYFLKAFIPGLQLGKGHRIRAGSEILKLFLVSSYFFLKLPNFFLIASLMFPPGIPGNIAPGFFSDLFNFFFSCSYFQSRLIPRLTIGLWGLIRCLCIRCFLKTSLSSTAMSSTFPFPTRTSLACAWGGFWKCNPRRTP